MTSKKVIVALGASLVAAAVSVFVYANNGKNDLLRENVAALADTPPPGGPGGGGIPGGRMCVQNYMQSGTKYRYHLCSDCRTIVKVDSSFYLAYCN